MSKPENVAILVLVIFENPLAWSKIVFNSFNAFVIIGYDDPKMFCEIHIYIYIKFNSIISLYP